MTTSTHGLAAIDHLNYTDETTSRDKSHLSELVMSMPTVRISSKRRPGQETSWHWKMEPAKKHVLSTIKQTECVLSSARRQTASRRTVAACLALVCAIIIVSIVLLGVAQRPTLQQRTGQSPTEELRRAAMHFHRAATNRRISGDAFIQGTTALLPWLDRIGPGLSSMVEVNLRKLENKGVSTTDLEFILADESRTGVNALDDSATVASLWNGRILQFTCAFLNDILNSPDLAKISPAVAAKRAYAATLEPHHSKFVRAAARALLSSIPSATTLFEERFGYAPYEINTTMRRDVTRVADSLQLFHEKLRALLHRYNHTL